MPPSAIMIACWAKSWRACSKHKAAVRGCHACSCPGRLEMSARSKPHSQHGCSRAQQMASYVTIHENSATHSVQLSHRQLGLLNVRKNSNSGSAAADRRHQVIIRHDVAAMTVF